ncbi:MULTISPECIES: response regulator [unclassified Rhizobium]|uniref:response regulator n=1 Tax=unclassified Rhizobium TaxID=2613769 RepID=UPI0011AB88B6
MYPGDPPRQLRPHFRDRHRHRNDVRCDGEGFRPFFTAKPTGSGTGLGLSMVYGFAKRSAGHLQLYSKLGEGTTVRLFLPRADAGKDSHPNEQRAEEAPPRGTETILVVEDDARVRRVTVSRLQTLAYFVIEATNGIDALKELEAGHGVALLFSDVAMPGMNDDELARNVRERWPRVKILLTSGFSEPHAAEKEIEAGAGWLKKPYTASEMSTRLRLLLAARPNSDSARQQDFNLEKSNPNLNRAAVAGTHIFLRGRSQPTSPPKVALQEQQWSPCARDGGSATGGAEFRSEDEICAQVDQGNWALCEGRSAAPLLLSVGRAVMSSQSRYSITRPSVGRREC